MIVSDLSADRLGAALAGPGLLVRTGPVVARIRSTMPCVIDGVRLHYAGHPTLAEDEFADFHVQVERPAGLRRWYRPQAVFSLDGEEPFTPLPAEHAFPLLEWGLNWCVYSHCNQYLVFHSAVLERQGRALLMPAHSGSGKSTLCAGLAFRGWRLLSDELAIIDPESLDLLPLPRPISLKNRSIDVIRAHAPDAVFGPVVHDTGKGSVAHIRPAASNVARGNERARPTWVVFPKFEPDAPAVLKAISPAQGFMQLLAQCFNYAEHGLEGFQTLAAVTERCAFYEFSYGRLDEAVALFDRMFDAPAVSADTD